MIGLVIRRLAILVGLASCGRAHFDALLDAAVDVVDHGTAEFLIAGNGNSTASVFAIDRATGELTQTAQGDIALGDVNVIDATPDGRFVYMPTFNADALYGFSIDPRTGTLTPIPGTPIAQPPGHAQAVRMHPTGRTLYSVNWGTTAAVLVYAIDPTTGELTQIQSVPAGAEAYLPDIDSSGTLMYVSTYLTTLDGYAIDPATGLLSVLGGFHDVHHPGGREPEPGVRSNGIVRLRVGEQHRLAWLSGDAWDGRVDRSTGESVRGSPRLQLVDHGSERRVRGRSY